MKNIVKRLFLLLILVFSFSIVRGQEFKYFIVEKTEGKTSTILPNFEKEPDFDNMKRDLMPKSMTKYTKSNLEIKFPDLFKKVEQILGENKRLFFAYYYNEKGEVIYAYFYASKEVLKKLTDELLLEIYNTFKGLKIEVDPSTIKPGEKMIGLLTMPFKGK